ncbi:hypothetical protein [Streptomyces sp. NPDC006307]|uniref:hypothetical protein n=1 Tax=Streptomyces sp. NPDC006307 TaxID=3156748 RepID=UPI0033AC488B
MTAAPEADELRVRNMLLGRGVGLNDMPPVPPMPDHPPLPAEPPAAAPVDVPPPPAELPAPAEAPAAPLRVPAPVGPDRYDWRKGPIDLAAPTRANEDPQDDEGDESTEKTTPTRPADAGSVKWINGVPHHVPPPPEPEDDADEPEDDADEDEDEEGEEADGSTSPAPAGPVEKVATTKAGKSAGSILRVRVASEDNRLRIIAFNGAAASIGYWAGVVPLFGQYLPYAEEAATGMLRLAFAAGGAVAGWRLSRPIAAHPAVATVIPFAPWLPFGVAVGAAEFGRQAAKPAVAWLDEHGQQWGLGSDAASLLLTVGSMCGGLWWFVDRRVRAWHWTARLLIRIPLASALLAAALYAPGT